MLLSDFDYLLPPGLIAERPAEPRDAARLLHVASGLDDLRVADLPRLMRAGDVMVVNDTRVIPARLLGRRGDVAIEVTLHQPAGEAFWSAFARPGKRLAEGDIIRFAEDFAAKLVEKREGGEILLDFVEPGAEGVLAALETHGEVPLPPYIKRDPDERDRATYQTPFADRPGAVAAPTAGLHFTPRLLTAIEAAGIAIVRVTLHVGAGTFLPVKTERIEEHRMHGEWAELTADAVARINRARAEGGRVLAVGTTSTRLLESAVDGEGRLHPFIGSTDLFITPGFRFRAVDRLLTNFHLPRSTLLMLVSAFAGRERILAAYAHAIDQGYRFYSYGDATLLERAEAK